MPFQVLLTDHPWAVPDIEREELATIGAELIDAPRKDEATLSELAHSVDAIATCWAQVTSQVLRSAWRCRMVARMGIGLDNIDLTTATARGMIVTNVPDYCVEEVADHTLGLILSLTRGIGFYHLRMKRAEYNPQVGPPIPRLRNCTLGLLGLGRIGRAVAERAAPFGLRLLAHTPSGNDYGTGCEMVSLSELLANSHIVSLHCPLSSATRQILNNQTFSLCRPGQYVINTSRGGLIDPKALYTALQSGRIAGAALDVFEPEPPDLGEPLYQDERVIATPHVAFVSQAAVLELRRRAMRQITTYLSGGTPENIVARPAG